ncbi:Oidioi.mRNA.OKI2018_I69.chr1.g1898.t1.cds [Oikopleura dioica]|uniref:Oidioi.mRNA.OKI2018_I69.chr1.g1898.t1.cds n=1 Tax=Oikopleura dioica TaxID=34765 RepID=A0ABN7ST76_OIKDI|nr:Oidioi.mRNA.OKI2018_I69.chr1.g1898.t1.cds [Oikopleura dioica]
MVFSFGVPEKVTFDKARCGDLLQTDAYINGKFVKTGATFSVTNPANGEKLTEVASCDANHTAAAIDAAEAAFKTWRKMTPKARGALVAKWGELITSNADKIGAIITFENGKPLGEGKGEANYSASFCEWAAAEGRRVHGETMSRKRSLLPQVSYLFIHLTRHSDLPAFKTKET